MAVGRLYTKGRALGHARGKRNTHPDTTIVALEGVATKEEAKFYLGKRVAYVYRGSKPINGSKVRVLWGKVTRSHGPSALSIALLTSQDRPARSRSSSDATCRRKPSARPCGWCVGAVSRSVLTWQLLYPSTI